MFHKLSLVVLLVLAACAAATPVATSPSPFASPVIADEYARTVLVVAVCADGRVGIGSGVHVSSHAVLTAHHVVSACGDLQVTVLVEGSDKQDYVAVVDADSRAEDVARLEVRGMPEVIQVEVHAIRIGDRTCATFAFPEVGRRCGDSWPSYADRPGDMHLDFVVEHGNSGGPVWDERGALVGITINQHACLGAGVAQVCTGGATSLADRRWLAQ